MKIRCVVIDDEKPARERIKRLISAHPDFEVAGEAADAASAIRLVDDLRPDVCFLDVQIPEGDGFRVLEMARHAPLVIFTTAYDEYAVRAFEVHSLDYLLKPFGRERFDEALDRARRALAAPDGSDQRMMQMLEEIRRGLRQPEGTAGEGLPARVPARRGARILLLDPADVLCFEAEETLVFARTVQGRFLVEKTLAELEEGLASSFFRAHRRYLVNLALIAEILPQEAGAHAIVLRDESATRVPLSRRQARRLRELIPW